jgi:hypothetical protein
MRGIITKEWDEEQEDEGWMDTLALSLALYFQTTSWK